MSGSDDKRSLLRVAEMLERAARQLRELAGESAGSPGRKTTGLPEGFVEGLRNLERGIAAQKLATLSHLQLGEVFAASGGPSRDKKRSKDWLVERVLWYLFDFKVGHEIVKGSR